MSSNDVENRLRRRVAVKLIDSGSDFGDNYIIPHLLYKGLLPAVPPLPPNISSDHLSKGKKQYFKNDNGDLVVVRKRKKIPLRATTTLPSLPSAF